MSTVSENVSVKSPYEQVVLIIRKAAISFGSLVEHGSTFEIKDNAQRTSWSTTWPATVKIDVQKNGNDRTTLYITASNFGIGPIQRKECESKLGAIKSAILIGVQEFGRTVPNNIINSPSGADEIKKYKDLLDNGIITQQEFDAKKKQILGI